MEGGGQKQIDPERGSPAVPLLCIFFEPQFWESFLSPTSFWLLVSSFFLADGCHACR